MFLPCKKKKKKSLNLGRNGSFFKGPLETFLVLRVSPVVTAGNDLAIRCHSPIDSHFTLMFLTKYRFLFLSFPFLAFSRLFFSPDFQIYYCFIYASSHLLDVLMSYFAVVGHLLCCLRPYNIPTLVPRPSHQALPLGLTLVVSLLEKGTSHQLIHLLTINQ